MAIQIFVNLPVKDLPKSIQFFTQLGYKFDARFTNDQATCMIIDENIYIMLLVESFFKTFTPKQISDAKKQTEVLMGLSVESRAKVDEIIGQAVSAGAKTPVPTQDHGFMYERSFEDLDGHIWAYFHMEPSAVPAEQLAETA